MSCVTGAEVPLPAGVMAGQAPQELKMTEEQVKQFEATCFQSTL